jgi:uncharacterized protein (TIGR03083 family)
MPLLLEHEYLTERAALVATVGALTPEQFASGPTLCDGWAPRDVLGHLIGVDTELVEYVKAFGRIGRGNAAIVARYRAMDRDELLAAAERWAQAASVTTRPMSWFYLGDLSIHHQDILRGQGRNRVIPLAVRDALLREGAFLGWKRLARHRVEPTDGGRAMGRGEIVSGTSEALALWLTGRRGLDDELEFSGRCPRVTRRRASGLSRPGRPAGASTGAPTGRRRPGWRPARR